MQDKNIPLWNEKFWKKWILYVLIKAREKQNKDEANKHDTNKNITQNYKDWQGDSKQSEQAYSLRLLNKCREKKKSIKWIY